MANSALEVLLIEDDPRDAELIRQHFKTADSQMSLFVEKNLNGGISRLEEHPSAAVLVDLTLPDGRGISAVARLHEKFPAIPIVALNVLENEILAIEVMREGAQDYLVKESLTPEVLKRTILFSIERKNVERELARLASFAWQNPNTILECDFSGKLIYLNPAGQILFPEIQDAFSAHPFLEGMEEVLEDLRRGGKTFLTREILMDPKYYEQHLSFVPERQVIRSYIADITERKSAEAALRERTAEVERMNRAMVGRELKMAELKREIISLKKGIGRAA